MDKKEILKRLEKEKDKIREKGVKKIGLFGSFVRGRQKKRSDIDILVKFDKISFDNYMSLYYFLNNLFKKKIDLVIEEDLKPEIKKIKNEVEYVKI